MSLEWARARALENAARRRNLIESGRSTYSLEICFGFPVVVTLSYQQSSNDGSWSMTSRATPDVRPSSLPLPHVNYLISAIYD
jgi:hypothetical protein